MTTIGFPILNTDVAFAITPRQVLLNRFLLFGMTAIVGILQGKLLQCRKMAFNPIEPRGIGRRPVKSDVVRFCIRQHLGLMMVRRIIQNNVQRFLSRVLPTQPRQKRQIGRPVLLGLKSPHQRIPLQIIRSEHVPHTAVPIVRRPQPIHMAGLGIMPTVSRQQIQWAELVDTDAAATRGTFGVQTLDSPVFGPKLRIRRILPGLGVPPFDLAAAQDLTQMFQRNRRDDGLGNQIVPQLGQRPDSHADQLLRRREGDLADLFDHVGSKRMRSGRPTIVRIPRNGIDPTVVETVNDASYPNRRTVAPLGNPGVCVAAPRQQNNSGVSVIDSIGQLVFHRVEFSALIRPKRPCFYRVHFGFSTLSRLSHTACGEPIYNTIKDGASLNLKILDFSFKISRNSITGNGISEDFKAMDYWQRIDVLADAIFKVFLPIEAVAMTPQEWRDGDSLIADYARKGEVVFG